MFVCVCVITWLWALCCLLHSPGLLRAWEAAEDWGPEWINSPSWKSVGNSGLKPYHFETVSFWVIFMVCHLDLSPAVACSDVQFSSSLGHEGQRPLCSSVSISGQGMEGLVCGHLNEQQNDISVSNGWKMYGVRSVPYQLLSMIID